MVYYILDAQMWILTSLMSLIGQAQICKRDSYFMDDTKTLIGISEPN